MKSGALCELDAETGVGAHNNETRKLDPRVHPLVL